MKWIIFVVSFVYLFFFLYYTFKMIRNANLTSLRFFGFQHFSAEILRCWIEDFCVLKGEHFLYKKNTHTPTAEGFELSKKNLLTFMFKYKKHYYNLNSEILKYMPLIFRSNKNHSILVAQIIKKVRHKIRQLLRKM